MKRQLAWHLAPFLAAVFACIGCNEPRRGPAVLIQIGDQESTLVHSEDVAGLRKEILDHIQKDWDRGNGTETEWIKISSRVPGDQQAASDSPGVDSEGPIDVVSERSTPVFRIRREEDARTCVVETKNEGGSVESRGQASAPDWPLLEALLLSVLNDSILMSILGNTR